MRVASPSVGIQASEKTSVIHTGETIRMQSMWPGFLGVYTFGFFENIPLGRSYVNEMSASGVLDNSLKSGFSKELILRELGK